MDDNQVPLIEPPSLADRMRLRGVDMTWYDRAKAKRQGLRTTGLVPLANERCCRLSIYRLKADGTLWTIDGEGKPYAKVRDIPKKPRADTYICVHCGGTFEGLGGAFKHF